MNLREGRRTNDKGRKGAGRQSTSQVPAISSFSLPLADCENENEEEGEVSNPMWTLAK